MINSEMYRQKINKIRTGLQGSLIIAMIGVLGFGVFGVQAGFLSDFLAETSAKLSDENYIHSIGGKTIITDLYYKSLEISRTNEVSSMNNAIKMSVEYMKTQYDQCNLNTTDMLNILYNSNDSFKRSFKQSISNSYKTVPQYPSDEDYQNSCHIFMGCFYGISQYKDSPYILQNCSNKANDIYYQMYINYDNIASFDQINFGDDVFWNGKLDDADFDLLYDIDILGKILFEGSKTPPQVLYYQFPNVDSLGGDITPDVPYDGTIDWFSPYNPSDFPSITTGTNNSGGYRNVGGSTNIFLSGASDLDISIEQGSLDQEIQNFLQSNSSNIYRTNQEDNGNIINGNICITGSVPQESPMNGTEISGEAIKQYLSGLTKIIKENKNKTNGSLTTGGGSFVSGVVINFTGEEVLSHIDDQVEMLSNIDDAASQEAIQGCIDKCDGLSIDEKVICIVKCTCTEFASPAYEDILKAGAFKIKFCMIPVKNKGFSKNGKTVYSIEEIYNEVSAILIALKDSGELLVSRKTKEFLESSTTKNKFGKIFSFSISSSFRSLFGESDSSTNKKQQEIFTENSQASVLGYSKDLHSAGEANRYMFMGTPASDISKSEIIESSTFGQNKGLTPLIDPGKLLQEERLIQLNSLVKESLVIHLKFWQDVVVMMEDINKTAQAMSKK